MDINRSHHQSMYAKGGTKNAMQLEQRTTRYDAVETGAADERNFEFAFAQRQRRKGLMLQVPTGLVVSSDQEVRRQLAQVLRHCALAPILATGVADGGTALVRNEISIVVCNDRLEDGKYEDIVKLAVRSEAKVPVIVVSQTGDWPEYLAAMRGGAFDFLAYPPVAGDLQQTIQNALLGRQRHFEETGEERWASTQ
jgi:DNA-binding NtrC family response regulator